MGKGVALEFKNRYPEMFQGYKTLCEEQKIDIGKLALWKSSSKWILLFPTKKHWRNPSKLEYIEMGLIKFTENWDRLGANSIAFPRLGCGNGGLDYKDILEKYKEQLPENIKWWYNFLYHFTDVHNVPSILYERYIWSRWIVEKTGVMQNDNASHAVIEATESNNKCYGRLYFRPLTPTQYHNEGYKPMKIRNSTINANCPVPVFLCLSANATLNLEETCYAEKGISGNRSNIQSGIDAFGKLNFSKIFHDGSYDPVANYDIKEYRQSEVVRENGFPVEPLLKCILCRSEAEREMLLFLLGQYSVRLYNTYKNKIIYNPKLHCF